MGPKPTKPLGVIVKFKEGVVGIAASGTGTARSINAELNLYKLSIKDGASAKDKAAELRKLSGERQQGVQGGVGGGGFHGGGTDPQRRPKWCMWAGR